MKGQLVGERHGWGQLRDDGRRARQALLDSLDGFFCDLDFSRFSSAAATSSYALGALWLSSDASRHAAVRGFEKRRSVCVSTGGQRLIAPLARD